MITTQGATAAIMRNVPAWRRARSIREGRRIKHPRLNVTVMHSLTVLGPPHGCTALYLAPPSAGFLFRQARWVQKKNDHYGLGDGRRLQDEAKAYRDRAAKMRADAEKTNDQDLKQQMLTLAQAFDGLAESAEALRKSGCKPG